MCGILGYYRKGGLQKEDLRKALSALDSLQHRGPDGAGISLIDTTTGKSWTLFHPDTPEDIPFDLQLDSYQDGQAHLLLGHRRLSIFDLSSRGHQPMSDEANNLIVFNGEVYNFLELREELRKSNHRFQTGTDTEVILAAYRQWGPDALRRFNGMWSILLYDPRAHKLLVSVDRIGVKQLYTYTDDDCVILASEAKAIRVLVEERLNLNPIQAKFFLSQACVDLSTETLFQEISRFPSAHFRYAGLADFAITPPVSYWEFPTGTKKFTTVERAAESLRSLLDDAIKLRMRSDVPWGTTLSGGLDSSSIVFAASNIRSKTITTPIRSFTAVFPGQEADESGFARRVAADLGLDAHFVNPMEEFDFDDFERFHHHQDFPVPNTSMYAQWQVMKAVGESPVKVLLDGQGGDELFAGYHHHVYKYGRDLLLHGRYLAYRRLVDEFCTLRGLEPATVKKYIMDDLKLYLRLKMGRQMDGPPQVTEWNRSQTLQDVLRMDIRSWVMPALLRYEDRNSMAFAVEARLPFLDYRMVEFAMQLPDEFKIHKGWQKYVLRLAMPELPELIRWRKDKKGFTTPHKEWVQRHKARFVEYAQLAIDRGIELPYEIKGLEGLDEIRLFRVASLGLWMRGQA